MNLLIVEPLETDVMQWLESRHELRFAPELALEPRALRQALFNVRAMIVPVQWLANSDFKPAWVPGQQPQPKPAK